MIAAIRYNGAYIFSATTMEKMLADADDDEGLQRELQSVNPMHCEVPPGATYDDILNLVDAMHCLGSRIIVLPDPQFQDIAPGAILTRIDKPQKGETNEPT